MLKGVIDEEKNIEEVKAEMSALVPLEYQSFISNKNEVCHINYPVLAFPEKVKSLKLERDHIIEQKLMGIKGQYLIFKDGVLNVRSHAGYRVVINF